MRLNKREVDLLGVTRDLFLKGSPEYRVAKYAHDNHFTQQQLNNFLSKIECLHGPSRGAILNHFGDISRGGCFDYPIETGNKLTEWLNRQKKVEITDA